MHIYNRWNINRKFIKKLFLTAREAKKSFLSVSDMRNWQHDILTVMQAINDDVDTSEDA